MRAILICKIAVFMVLVFCFQLAALAQHDTSAPKKSLEGFLKKQNGLIGNLARNLMNDTGPDNVKTLVRNDLSFNKYEGKIIRNIYIQRLDFGTLIEDTSKSFNNTFTHLANTFHRKSREYVIKNNLFFRKGDKVASFLFADNERHLRDQPFIQDASIIFVNVYGTEDSVDVVVRTKDVLSIGGSFTLHNPKSVDLSVKEDNLKGWGNGIEVSALYDQNRQQHGGFGVEYITRNIGGSFIDGSIGYKDFANTFTTGQKEEQLLFARFVRPLVNPYTKWTYLFEIANHVTQNMFLSDSLYQSDVKYRYFNYDAWMGLNTGAYKLKSGNDDGRLRTLVSLRYFKQLFLDVPGKYANQYYYQYADITGVLGAVSVFKQNFYKTKYYYGFGRNEDVPEGIDVSLTAGWVNKQQLKRPYAGIDIQRYYFTNNKAYYNFTFRTGVFWHSRRFEDFNALLSVDHYSRLSFIGNKWKERSFLNASITGQVNKVLNAPLSLESSFGLPEYRNSGTVGGVLRSTIKGESVFFSPYNFINFHFAAFVFGNVSMLTPPEEALGKSDIYSSLGAGIRTRNESLIFGTFEIKVFYFPRKNFYNESWRFETSTNIKFKYNNQLIKRPEIINVN